MVEFRHYHLDYLGSTQVITGRDGGDRRSRSATRRTARSVAAGTASAPRSTRRSPSTGGSSRATRPRPIGAPVRRRALLRPGDGQLPHPGSGAGVRQPLHLHQLGPGQQNGPRWRVWIPGRDRLHCNRSDLGRPGSGSDRHRHGIRTGDASSGFAAFGISAAFGYGTFGLGSAIAVPLSATPGLIQIGIGVAAVGYGAYGTYEAVDNGYYATGSVGVLATAFGLYELLAPASGEGGTPQGGNGADAQARSEMLASVVKEGRQFDQRFSGTRVEIGYHELGSGKGTHTYLTASGRYSSAFPSGNPGGVTGQVSATLYQSSTQSESGWGLLTPEFGASDPAIYSDLSSPPAATQAFYTASSPVSVRSGMAEFAAQINAARIPYNPILSNSNSYTFQLAENVLGFRPEPLLRAVAYSATLP